MNRRTLLKAIPAAATFAASAAAPRASIESVDIVSFQPRFYHAWPTMIRQRATGHLLATYSGSREAHVCPFGRVEMVVSRDEGRTWSFPRVLMDTFIDDRDSGIVETGKGTLLVTTFTSLAYEKILAEANGQWDPARLERWKAVQRATTPELRESLRGAWMLRSTDGGLSWGTPYRVPVTSPHGPIALANGRLLFPGKRYPQEGGEIGVCESKDDGQTWTWAASIPSRDGDHHRDYHELHGVETGEPGRLIVHVRNHNKTNDRETLQSESLDNGRTWSKPRSIGVWGLPSHLLRLKDDRLMMTYSYRRSPRGNHARISEDHGRTWSEPIVLSSDGIGDLGYPSTVQLEGGGLVTLWYEARISGETGTNAGGHPMAVLRQARWALL
ncbi:MAG: sialidase family protein [Bryobacteraceae bacterium]